MDSWVNKKTTWSSTFTVAVFNYLKMHTFFVNPCPLCKTSRNFQYQCFGAAWRSVTVVSLPASPLFRFKVRILKCSTSSTMESNAWKKKKLFINKFKINLHYGYKKLQEEFNIFINNQHPSIFSYLKGICNGGSRIQDRWFQQQLTFHLRKNTMLHLSSQTSSQSSRLWNQPIFLYPYLRHPLLQPSWTPIAVQLVSPHVNLSGKKLTDL